jgi:hypothetical protein
VGDIQTAFSSAVPSNYWGYTYYPYSGAPFGGDVWLNTTALGPGNASWSAGSFNAYSMIHELGHALGLKHDFEGAVQLTGGQESRLYTVMSFTPLFFAAPVCQIAATRICHRLAACGLGCCWSAVVDLTCEN